jgi:competence ComEA-like helix-hairpin-helix protein
MKEFCKKQEKDCRVPVLLLLGGGILASSWFPTGSESLSSVYFFLTSVRNESPAVIRRLKGQSTSRGNVNGITLTATSCQETPPQLAMFFSLPMPVNRADHDALTMLPGIGPRLADNIIAYRREYGNIAGAGDLKRVVGIGTNLTKKLLPIVCFD